jgi:hypothetical protein
LDAGRDAVDVNVFYVIFRQQELFAAKIARSRGRAVLDKKLQS